MSFRIIGFRSQRAFRSILDIEGVSFEWRADIDDVAAHPENFDGAVVWEPESPAVQDEAIMAIRFRWPRIPILVASPFPLSDDVNPDNLDSLGPLNAAQLREALRERWTLSAPTPRPSWRKHLMGDSRQTLQIVETINLIADRRSTVLITGETGTGKEVVARSIHQRSNRSSKPMVTVNCAALPETLLEAELFGNTKGAFTGANSHRIGYIEKAHGGTLFLDEIGDMPLETQAKLLRVLQEREFQRIGSPETIPVDIRVIAATNVDLRRAVAEKRFRSDLFFRLNVIPINIAPLRDRPIEVPQLVRHFIEKTCSQEGIPSKTVHPEALSRLIAFSWPGNVRQLEHAVEMAVVLSGMRHVLTIEDFEAILIEEESTTITQDHVLQTRIPSEGMDFNRTLEVFQRALMQAAMRKADGNQSRAAQLLGMKRTTMISRFKALGTAAN